MFLDRKGWLISAVFFISLIPLVALGAPDYLVHISINSSENVTFANHSDSLTEGNWIELNGGTSIELPQLVFVYNGVNNTVHTHSGKTIAINASLNQYSDFSVRYPLTRHAMYTNVSGKKLVNATFYGDTSFNSNKIDWHLILTGPTELKNALNDSLYGNTTPFRNLLDNAVYKNLNQFLNTTGDNQTSFGELNAGDYVVIVKLNETNNNLTLLSATTFQVLEYESTLTAASSATIGGTLDVTIQMVNATNGTYRFGTVIIHENAYNAELWLRSNGSTSGTNLTADGQFLIDQMKILGVGMNAVNASRVKSIVEGVIGSNNGSVNYADPTTNKYHNFSINTDGLNAGRYIMIAAVWHIGGDRLVAFAQQNITLSSPAAPPSEGEGGGGGGGGGGGAAFGEPYENVDVKEVSYILTIAANQHICKQFARNHSIIEICFTYSGVADEVSITIEKLLNRSLLVNVSPPEIVYEHDNIWVNLPNQALVSNASIKIRVDRNWINANKIDTKTIAMYRYREDAWNKLGTAKLSEDDKFIVFLVSTPGFSPFAITGEKAVPTPTATPTRTPVFTPTATVTPTATLPMTPTPEPGVQEEEMLFPLIISGIIGSILGFLLILMLITRVKE